ncbi:pseudouridine synthase [Chitinophaga sp.]|uniref:pseudouridine synthase n=1 Tax=Chitinophaga sp. TaxID=1869181 RepID=UPI0025B88A8A|nr:pseudouridine synthase [Chitinophaga sp.]
MKKKLPASKGFSPFKENKSGKQEKPAAGNRNRPSFDGERPGRASAKDDNRDDRSPRKRSFGSSEEGKAPRKRTFGSDKPGDKPTFRKRSDDNDKADEKPAFRKRTFGGDKSDEKPAFRKRSFGSDKSDEKPAFRKRSFDKDKSDEKPAFRKRSFDSDKSDEKPAFRKRSFDTDKPTHRKKDNYSSENESSFHGDRNDKTSKNAKETPSGFNRKKFFDRVNDRFADKHERRRTPIKSKGSSEAPAFKKESKTAKEGKASTFGPGEMPLNKFIAHCGLCSRRKAVDYIREGKVTVNGMVVKEPATKVTAKDNIALLEKKITLQKNLVYILLNKPKGYITTTDDPEGRKTVMELIEDAVEDERVYPVGRLDRNTSGLLLLTNDGELAQTLAHPKHNIKKIYQVELDKPLTKADFEKIIAGVTLEDGVALVDALGYVDPKDKKQVGIEIHSGKNRIVRRIFEHLEYNVEKLDRVMYAGLTKKTLNRGQWRFLSEKEVILLKHFKK